MLCIFVLNTLVSISFTDLYFISNFFEVPIFVNKIKKDKIFQDNEKKKKKKGIEDLRRENTMRNGSNTE